jgi:hypothetical protein
MIISPRGFHKAATGIVLSLTVLLAPAADALADVTSRQVKDTVAQAIADIKSQQQNNGHWPRYGGYEGGTTALAALALLNAGLGLEDPAVQRAVDAVARAPNERTYVVSLKCQVLAAADPQRKRYDRQLRNAAEWLVKAQTPVGMWGYRAKGSRGDNSNTQFALLGLHEADKTGLEVPEKTWRLAKLHFANTQLRDGSWHYNYSVRDRNRRAGARSGYGSMTAAAVASLYICGQELLVSGPKVLVNGAWPSCGKYQQNVVIAKGLEWMARNFSVRQNPGRGNSWLYYYLYGLERVGMISGQRTFGRHDWYRQGAEYLVDQYGQGWGNQRMRRHGRGGTDASFALLFLAKGNRPVLFQKLRWEGQRNKSDWNRNIHDLENLTSFVSEAFEQQVTWQTANLDLPLQALRVSPILYITGHEFPQFTPAEKNKLQAFVDSGGTLLAEACCSSEEFRAGFNRLARELWKDYPLRALPESHPVFGSFYALDETYDLHGIDIGCRTGVFFSTRPLAVLWEMKDLVHQGKKLSRYAFQLGTNIAAYATGREQLANKLDVVELPERDDPARPNAEAPRGAVRIARLFHNGDYNADPKALLSLAAMLRDKASVDVVAKERHLRATDETLYEYPVVFMTGHYEFKLADDELEALGKYLKRGGFLFADACCGQPGFDKSFRAMVAKLFPQAEFEKLPRDHPIISGKVGQPLGRLKYRQILAEQLKEAGRSDWSGTNHPPLHAVKLDGRIVLLYSPYDFSCALEGDKPYSCRGYVDADGRNLAMNIVLYAITY